MTSAQITLSRRLDELTLLIEATDCPIWQVLLRERKRLLERIAIDIN